MGGRGTLTQLSWQLEGCQKGFLESPTIASVYNIFMQLIWVLVVLDVVAGVLSCPRPPSHPRRCSRLSLRVGGPLSHVSYANEKSNTQPTQHHLPSSLAGLGPCLLIDNEIKRVRWVCLAFLGMTCARSRSFAEGDTCSLYLCLFVFNANYVCRCVCARVCARVCVCCHCLWPIIIICLVAYLRILIKYQTTFANQLRVCLHISSPAPLFLSSPSSFFFLLPLFSFFPHKHIKRAAQITQWHANYQLALCWLDVFHCHCVPQFAVQLRQKVALFCCCCCCCLLGKCVN